MADIGFPISREAACCGIYIYLGSTRVGMKSKEQLRSDYLRMYEDNYKRGLERRRKKLLEQRARDNIVSSPTNSSVESSANSFLSMFENIPRIVEKAPIIIEDDWSSYDGAVWEEPIAESQKKYAPKVEEVYRNWVSHGVELFSLAVRIEPKVVTTEVVSTNTESVIWDEPEEVEWSIDEDMENTDESLEGGTVDSSKSDDVWADDSIWGQEKSDSEQFTNVQKSMVEQTKNRSVQTPKTFSEVKNVPKPPKDSIPQPVRLDENSIRDFVKSHKLCSESDICNAFSGVDNVRVRSVIKSALRKYKIFEKHGRFTV